MDRLSALLGNAVQFVYSCWDRLVLNGYIERLQRPENLIYFFHDVVGMACIEPAVLEQRTKAYKAWVRRMAEEHNIRVLTAPSAAKGGAQGGFRPTLLPAPERGRGCGLRADQSRARPYLRFLRTAVDASQWRRQLPFPQGLS